MSNYEEIRERSTRYADYTLRLHLFLKIFGMLSFLVGGLSYFLAFVEVLDFAMGVLGGVGCFLVGGIFVTIGNFLKSQSDVVLGIYELVEKQSEKTDKEK